MSQVLQPDALKPDSRRRREVSARGKGLPLRPIRRVVFFGVVIVAILYAVLRWFDRSGEVMWSYPAEPAKGELFDLAISGSLLISLFEDGSCFALRQDGGAVAWAHLPGTFPFRPRHLLLFRDHVLVGGDAGITLLQRQDGQILWNRSMPMQSGDSWTAGESGLLVSQLLYQSYDDALNPSPPGTCAGSWSTRSKVCLIGWEDGADVWTRTDPSFAVEQLAWLGSGALILSHRQPVVDWVPCELHGEPDTMARIQCADCRYEQIQESSFLIEVVDPQDAEEIWTTEIPAATLPLAKVSGDRLMLVTPRAAISFSPSGDRNWDVEFTDVVTVATQTDSDLFVCLRDTQLISIDLASGKPRWQRELDGAAELLLPGHDRVYAVVAGLEVESHDSENPVERMIRKVVTKVKYPYYPFYLDTSRHVYFAAYRSSDGRRIWHRRMDSGTAATGSKECFLLLRDENVDSAVHSEIHSCSPGRGRSNWMCSTYAYASDIMEGENSVFFVSTSSSPRAPPSSIDPAPTLSKIIALRPRGLANRLTRF